MSFDVFISYSTKDATAAKAACAALEADKVRCWIAPRDIVPGAKWGASIVRAINECRVVVLIFSGSANDSDQVQREVDQAFSKGKAVVPLRIEDVKPADELAYYLDTVHWLDALTPPFEKNLEKLVGTVQALLPATETEPSSEFVIGAQVARAQDDAPAHDDARAQGDARADDELWTVAGQHVEETVRDKRETGETGAIAGQQSKEGGNNLQLEQIADAHASQPIAAEAAATGHSNELVRSKPKANHDQRTTGQHQWRPSRRLLIAGPLAVGGLLAIGGVALFNLTPPTGAPVQSGPLRFDGVYQRPDPGSVSGSGAAKEWGYLRFYSDGTVLETYSLATVEQLSKWFNKSFDQQGKYVLTGNQIQFSIKSKAGVVDFNGVANNNSISLSWFSHINNQKAANVVYNFVSW